MFGVGGCFFPIVTCQEGGYLGQPWWDKRKENQERSPVTVKHLGDTHHAPPQLWLYEVAYSKGGRGRWWEGFGIRSPDNMVGVWVHLSLAE